MNQPLKTWLKRSVLLPPLFFSHCTWQGRLPPHLQGTHSPWGLQLSISRKHQVSKPGSCRWDLPLPLMPFHLVLLSGTLSLLYLEVSGASSGPSRLPVGAAIFVPGSVLRRSHVLLHFCLPFYLTHPPSCSLAGCSLCSCTGSPGHSVLLCVLPSSWNYLSTFPYLDK